MVKPGVAFAEETLGALEIGVLLSSLLYGLSCGQVYLFAVSPKDRPPVVTLIVAFVLFLETVHLTFMWIYFFDITITQFGDLLAVASVTWRYGVLLSAHALLVTTIELFFCYRISMLSRRIWIAFPPALASIVRGAITLAISVMDVTLGFGILGEQYLSPLFNTTLIISAMVDSYITVCLCTLLWSKKTESRAQSTIKIVNEIIYWTIETGIFTTTTAVAILVVFKLLPLTGYWNALLMIYPRLYANSFLISLGTIRDRDSWKGSRRATFLGDFENCNRRSVIGGVATPSLVVEMPEYSRSSHSQEQHGSATTKMDQGVYGQLKPVPIAQVRHPQKTHGAPTSYWSVS